MKQNKIVRKVRSQTVKKFPNILTKTDVEIESKFYITIKL